MAVRKPARHSPAAASVPAHERDNFPLKGPGTVHAQRRLTRTQAAWSSARSRRDRQGAWSAPGPHPPVAARGPRARRQGPALWWSESALSWLLCFVCCVFWYSTFVLCFLFCVL